MKQTCSSSSSSYVSDVKKEDDVYFNDNRETNAETFYSESWRGTYRG